jgi:hypothetical protein
MLGDGKAEVTTLTVFVALFVVTWTGGSVVRWPGPKT